MIISKTPHRISMFGGSCDYPSYYNKHGALLIGCAIQKHCYVSCRPLEQFSNNLVEFYGTQAVEKVKSIEELRNPAVRGVLQYLNHLQSEQHKPIHISTQADLPVRTGVGSSSTFIVGLWNILQPPNYSEGYNYNAKTALARAAIHVERILLKEPGGIQDQIWAAYGGFNSIQIDSDGMFCVKPLPLCPDFIQEFNDSMILIYTGNQRNSFEVASTYDDPSAIDVQKRLHNVALEALDAFYDGDWHQIGYLLDQTWKIKQNISDKIAPPHVGKIYDRAKEYGAIGCKLLGAGNDGFLFCLVPPHKMEYFKREIDLPFFTPKVEFQGSTIIYNEH